MPGLLPPPFDVPMYGQDGFMTPSWQAYTLQQQTAVDTALAPVDAEYVVATASGPLTAERNLGALATGYLKITVALGVATPLTATTIPATDIAAGTAGINISGNAATATAATTATTTTGNAGTATALQTARLINGVSFNGTANITVTASANTLSGTALPAVDGSALTGLTLAQIAGLASGTYTPTLTGVANVAASTAYPCQYLRVGATVTVSGKVDIDPTSAATLTQLGVSLPIASNFGNDYECGGAASAPVLAGATAAILADAANNRAEVQFTTGADVANRSWWLSFTYQVI